MLTFLLLIAILGLYVLIQVSRPVAWAMLRLRLIYPVITFIIFLYLDGHREWKITQFVRATPFPNSEMQIRDIIFWIVILLSAAALLQELIQMVFPDFTWIGVIFFIIFLPKRIKNKKVHKIQQAQEAKFKELEQNALMQFVVIRSKVYKAMPDMEKEYYYFRGICSSEDELATFESDWEEYIKVAYNRLETDENDLYTFDEWFGDNKKWKTRTYNKEFLAKDRQQRQGI